MPTSLLACRPSAHLAPRKFFHKPTARLFIFCGDPLNAIPSQIEAVLSEERAIIDSVNVRDKESAFYAVRQHVQRG